ncbi:uncharacterized protein [Drosophila virilis]|uniref:uncharacterized protein n=1 Tax=Drosophila virilis TaxID=7244 RepID=UPI0038B2D369
MSASSFVSPARHLELVKDLSTATFLSALERFIATRGKPSQIWSDNATSFVGSKKEMVDLKRLLLSDPHMEAVRQFCLADDIEWKFIPPRSTHCENPSDLDVLTPAHLLLGGPSSAIIEPDLTKLNYDRFDGWQRVTQLQQVFWAQWREEYLILLPQRAKWRTQTQALCINDMVLVKGENLPPMRW